MNRDLTNVFFPEKTRSIDLKICRLFNRHWCYGSYETVCVPTAVSLYVLSVNTTLKVFHLSWGSLLTWNSSGGAYFTFPAAEFSSTRLFEFTMCWNSYGGQLSYPKKRVLHVFCFFPALHVSLSPRATLWAVCNVTIRGGVSERLQGSKKYIRHSAGDCCWS